MNTHADKSQENKSQSVSNGESQMQTGGEATFEFEDNRPEAIAQSKIQEMANNSPQVSHLMAFQDMANNSPRTEQAAQLQAMADNHSTQQKNPIQKKENNTGLPDNLKTGMENLSGMSLDDVKVHRNSEKPAQLQAHAYAQGTDIHLGLGQEKHLPHEAWHVVQQKQGRVKPTMQMKGKVNINDDPGLEKEADVMGAKALQLKSNSDLNINTSIQSTSATNTIQRVPDWMQNLFEIARANPITSIATLGFGAAGILAYYYWNREPQAPPLIQQQNAPDITTIGGIAQAIGVDPDLLRTQLEQGVGDIDVSQLYDVDIIPWQVNVTGIVPPTLIANLPENLGDKVNEIFARINAIDFNYTGIQGNAAGGFLSRSGDCATLALMFQLATVAAGVEGVELRHDFVPMLVPQGPIHGRNTTSNVDGQEYWSFRDHHWCEYNGQHYDLLFMNNGPQVFHRNQADQIHNGVSYDTFDGGQAIIYPGMFNRLTTNIGEESQGYVGQTVQEIHDYIDANRQNE